MKGYYLYAPVDCSSVGAATGIERKVRSQHKILSEHFSCDLVILPPVEFHGSIREKIIRRLPFTAAWRKWKYSGGFDDADFVYIRAVDHDDTFVKYLRDIKRNNPTVKIIYEIPTYPYGEDDRYNLSNFMFLLKERTCRIRAAKYMDRIVTFYGQNSIWGVPCLKLMNGYDFSSVALPNREKPQTIELISVASTASWHGYDRVFKGLREYYDAGGTEIINFHVVGTILPEHEELVSDLKLENCVIFHGKLFGDALYDIYQKCSIGIDVLGGFRIGYTISSSLKSREYAAYGMPLITASPVDYLPEDCPYQLILPNNDEPIDMQKVVAFFHELYDDQDSKSLASKIREYGIQRIDMHVTMEPILKYIESN